MPLSPPLLRSAGASGLQLLLCVSRALGARLFADRICSTKLPSEEKDRQDQPAPSVIDWAQLKLAFADPVSPHPVDEQRPTCPRLQGSKTPSSTR